MVVVLPDCCGPDPPGVRPARLPSWWDLLCFQLVMIVVVCVGAGRDVCGLLDVQLPLAFLRKGSGNEE